MRNSALGPALAACVAIGAGCAALASEAPSALASDAHASSIPIRVVRPEGAGPFPAVVLLHDCSGLGPRSSGAPSRWADVLVHEGYVVLIPDSFSTRGHPQGVCTEASRSRFEVGPYRRADDAYEALAYARSLPYVDGARVGVMGGSHGGSTTLATDTQPRADRDGRRTQGFAAAIALYPGCGERFGAWDPHGSGTYEPLAPLLILIGASDDWTPAAPCEELARRAQAAGYPVSIKVYPGAHHAFDSAAPVRYVAQRYNPNAPGGRGATTGGNPQAWADSIAQVKAFFAAHLRGGPR